MEKTGACRWHMPKCLLCKKSKCVDFCLFSPNNLPDKLLMNPGRMKALSQGPDIRHQTTSGFPLSHEAEPVLCCDDNEHANIGIMTLLIGFFPHFWNTWLLGFFPNRAGFDQMAPSSGESGTSFCTCSTGDSRSGGFVAAWNIYSIYK